MPAPLTDSQLLNQAALTRGLLEDPEDFFQNLHGKIVVFDEIHQLAEASQRSNPVDSWYCGRRRAREHNTLSAKRLVYFLIMLGRAKIRAITLNYEQTIYEVEPCGL